MGLHGLYCSGEMFHYHLVARGLATDAGVWHKKMRFPERLTDEDKIRLGEAAECQCKICTILDGELSIARIRIAARRKAKKEQLHLVVIDYDMLVDAPGKDWLERQTNVIKGAKRIAMQFHVPVLLISQLNKNIKYGETVSINSLFGASAKPNDATVILYVERKFLDTLEKEHETDARFLILKARDGGMGVVQGKFDINTLRFKGDASEEQWQNITRQNAPEAQESVSRAAVQADLGILGDPEPPDEESC
jgi:replicative DNA helicase